MSKFDGNPELINDDPSTAPSKRLVRYFPEYRKVTDGISITESIGVQTMRGKCRHFDSFCKLIDDLD